MKKGSGSVKVCREERGCAPTASTKGQSSSSGPSVAMCMEKNMEKSEELRQKWERLFRCVVRWRSFLLSWHLICMCSHRESEQFEDTAIDRADVLLKDVYALREALQIEKDALTDRLKNVAGLLDK